MHGDTNIIPIPCPKESSHLCNGRENYEDPMVAEVENGEESEQVGN